MDLVKDWSAEERQAMRSARPGSGLQDAVPQDRCRRTRKRMLEISSAGLMRRAAQDSAGMTEDGFLNPLRELVDRGYTRAEELLRRFHGDWNGDLAPLFKEYNFL